MGIIVRAGDVSPEAIGEAVARVLASDEFGSSKRMRRFLSYIVEKSLGGKFDEVREYNTALAVFDREPSFDPATDTIVRVEARRLRQRLAAYYAGAGRLDPVVIEIPKGGYVAVFRNRTETSPEAPAVPTPLWRRPSVRFAGAALLVAAMGLVPWQFSSRFRSRVPHEWQLEGTTLRILDARDRLCWQKRFGPFDPAFGPMVVDKVRIADIDNDGRVEVLFNHLPEGGGTAGGSLLCFEQDGRLRWEFHYGRPRTFGTRTFDASYRGRLIRLVKLAGKPLLLTVANHYLWYPSQVALVDPVTARVVEEYWHPGSIYYCFLQDIDQDGYEEAVFGALNNPGPGLGHAAVGILKLPFSKAPRQPSEPAGPFPPLTGGGEFAYALLPMPDVNQAMGLLPVLAHFKVDPHGITAEIPMPESGGIVYDLDFHLNVREHRFSDNFVPLHHRYYVQRLLDHRLTGAETKSLGRVVTFAAAPDGNSPALQAFWKF